MVLNISVVVPTLNEEQNITELFRCLEGQLVEGDEVIVVDGGSDDSTRDIAKDAGARVLLAEDSSIGVARGIGTDYASNEIVASMDADSLPPDGWIERVRKQFEEDDDLVVLWGVVEDKDGMPLRSLTRRVSTIFRGASGNNTAFRKSAYEELEKGYPDISFLEDVVIIDRLSSMGKARHDRGLKMRMNMDRFRYQTVPVAMVSLASIGGSRLIDNRLSRVLKGFGLGAIGTEAMYERATGTPLDHDEVGAGIASAGSNMGGSKGDVALGIGSGVIAHHVMTEGFSPLKSTLAMNTDEEAV